MKLQRQVRTRYYDLPVHCGFCGAKVVDYGDGESEPQIQPCKHTLFIAHDEGFEYVSERVEQQLREKGFVIERDGSLIEVMPTDEDAGHDGIDRLTDQLEFPDGNKVAAYVSPPGGMGTYVGFAPIGYE